MHQSNLNLYRVGQLVTLKQAFLNAAIGTVCYVYEAYLIGREAGVSLITADGEDLGGFNLNEQYHFLKHHSDTQFFYEFRSVIFLDIDFRKGMFDQVFQKVTEQVNHDQCGPRFYNRF